ncbi:MAG: P22AR C-terminal domain-containing protein [Pasteurellaceae bacterium]|nr:P22AR C-terminal domain-containing protein [Pasteurellaceae bacterium]
MSNLAILETSIRQYDNLYSLNDLHLASGNDPKHRPTYFVKNQQTQELIAEIQSEDNCIAVKVIRGTQGGTYACEELALAYAMWISPKFHLVVLRAFIAMHKGQSQNTQPNLPLVEPEKTYTFDFTEYELEQLAWLAFSHKQMNDLLEILIQPMEAIGSRYSAMVYSHHHEYKRHYSESLDTVRRLIEPFKQSKRMNWERVVKRLN